MSDKPFSIVRSNLMEREGYEPYCGFHTEGFVCMQRAKFDGEQFKCASCGWRSSYESEFIQQYKAKWGKA